MLINTKVTPTGVLVATAGSPEHVWLDQRRSGLGGSDIAALLGMDPYTSATELYLEKRGELPDIPMSPALEKAARWGHLHEDLIAAEFARRFGVRTQRIGLIRHADVPHRLASLDRKVLGCPLGPCLLEIKNRSAWKASEWGPDGDADGVPDREALQTHWYLAVTGYTHAHVAVLINGNDDRYYVIGADAEIAADVTAMADEFWARIQDGNPPPVDGTAATTDLLPLLWTGDPDKSRVVDEAETRPLLARREELKARSRDLAVALAAVENQMKALLGEAEVAVCDGQPVFTWRRNGTFASGRFRAEHPDLAAKYSRMTLAFDARALADGDPALYRAYRARQLRTTDRKEHDLG